MKKLLSWILSFALVFGFTGSLCLAEETVTQKEIVKEETYSGKVEKVNNFSTVEQILGVFRKALFDLKDFGINNYLIIKNWFNSFSFVSNNWISRLDDFKYWLNSTYYDAKDWTSGKCDALKAVLNSTYYDTKDWTSEKYDAGKVWFNEADASKKVAAGVGLATFLTLLLGTIVHCCKRADTPVAAVESIPEVYDEFADDMRHWGANLN